MSKIYYASSPLPNSRSMLLRMKWLIEPILKSIFDKDSPINIDIDSQDNVTINDVPIGDFHYMSNFRFENDCLVFDYGIYKRYVWFGMKLFKWDKIEKVMLIHECSKTNSNSINIKKRLIYDRYKDDYCK